MIGHDDNGIIGHEKNTADMEVVFYWNYNSYHTIQIFISFIYLSNLSLNRYCFFSYSCAKSCKLMTVIMFSFAISWQKTLFRMNAQFRANEKPEIKSEENISKL